ncbi:MAG TPA: hypothetical protein VN081_00635 [Dongiaceae bacterium]|nr:hypothetical protein [Dongiaceae bacterium]
MSGIYWQSVQFRLVAQAYGTNTYGSQLYSANTQQGQSSGGSDPSCTQPTCATVPQAPNTSFFGLPADAVVPFFTGTVFLAIAITGVIFLIVAKRRRKAMASKHTNNL